MKIFVVVGSMFPFDRLIKTIDEWASDKKDIVITAQIGASSYVPKNLDFIESLNAIDFNNTFAESDLVISHAGMGVILKSLVENKPIIVMPRLLKFKELTTDHQLATAKVLRKRGYVNVAMDEEELVKLLAIPQNISVIHKINEFASKDLINALRLFFQNN
jgi:UDP-N-acetylglucosamine transferase subunit ALG13